MVLQGLKGLLVFMLFQVSGPEDSMLLNNEAVQLNDNGIQEELLYEDSIRRNPMLLEPRINLALLYMQTGRLESAVFILERALTQFRNDPDLLYLLGLAQASSGNLMEAAKAFEGCLDRKPEYVDASYNLGLLYWNPRKKQGDLANKGRAEFYWKRTLAANPQYSRAAEGLLSLYLHLGRYQEAAAIIGRLPAESLSQDGRLNASKCMEKIHDPGRAAHYLKFYLKGQNEPPKKLSRKLRQLESKSMNLDGAKGRKRDGIAETDPIQEPARVPPSTVAETVQEPISPGEPEKAPIARTDISTLYLSGLSALSDSQFPQASEIFRQVAKVQSDYRDVQWYLASSLLELGREREAEQCLREAIRQNKNHPYAYVTLGILLEKTGRFDEALQMYTQGIEVAPDGVLTPAGKLGIERIQKRTK